MAADLRADWLAEAARFSRPVPVLFDPSHPGAAHNWLGTADR